MQPGKLRPTDVGREWVKAIVHDGLPGLAAELAYWFFLSLFPFFIFLTALGGFVAAAFAIRLTHRRGVEHLHAAQGNSTRPA